MANEASKIKDPFGNIVYLPLEICVSKIDQHNSYDDAKTVIEKPALLIEITEGTRKERYYFRSVGWHVNLLISVRYNADQWEAYRCAENPSNKKLSHLLKTGKQLI